MSQIQWYFEDFQEGQNIELGEVAISEAEILEFARRFDPQPFHIDREAATRAYGGLIASGFHTGSLVMRLVAEGLLNKSSNTPSPGMDEVRWLKPVRGGDTLSVRCAILATRASASKPDRGVVNMRWEARNQHGELVMSAKVVCLFGVRGATT
ncbi:MaoC family dehydratase [Janthinobacterium sp. 17J80-10]|uniref:MaoC family dehydratase n=1 Tax=Janthinobacterium sp. 17J80-10 TaxID=2497863 RepID=UPI00100592F2|nr:MaoC family dehydratase [Janthinobacterium sp. 17J80-10]QAU34267.1 MaoC family dehydratase [Janthinobacterium sp. 17J80-10]